MLAHLGRTAVGVGRRVARGKPLANGCQRRAQAQAALADGGFADEERPSVLWSPGGQADEGQTDRLAGKIGVLCRDGKGLCVIGARGELPVARALRALAKASEYGKSAIEFRTRWHEDPGNERSLRFYAEMPYTWSAFKLRWKPLQGKVRVMPITPHSSVHKVATAMATEQRKVGAVALKINHKNDTVMAIAAKALATLPHSAQSEELGMALACVLRWPMISDEAAGKFIYAHVVDRRDAPDIDREHLEQMRKGRREGRARERSGEDGERGEGGEDFQSWAKQRIA